jgi:hypothetical protein
VAASAEDRRLFRCGTGLRSMLIRGYFFSELDS